MYLLRQAQRRSLYPEQTNIIASSEIVNQIRPIYNTLTTNRNSLAHANATVTYKKLNKDRFCVIKCLKMVSSSYQNLESTKIFLESIEKLFINLSNHPSKLWGEKQIAEAQKYGTIKDIPFPSISPGASNEEMEKMADTMVNEILKKAENTVVTVHVMGEMTFTYALVSRLKAEGVTCVASTTERIAEEKDGVKTSEFKFVRFREY